VTTALVENTTNDPVANEALAASRHFGYNVNATYFVFAQPGTVATAYGTVYCAYHSETSHSLGSRGARYAFMPYVPEQGAGCGVDSVNQNDAYGHGYFDSYSIVAGHEFAEAETDPDNYNGTQDGWNDVQTNENGDKCAWTGLQNITLHDQYFAIQPLWSNAAAGGQGACAVNLG
jgi:serine protease